MKKGKRLMIWESPAGMQAGRGFPYAMTMDP